MGIRAVSVRCGGDFVFDIIDEDLSDISPDKSIETRKCREFSFMI